MRNVCDPHFVYPVHKYRHFAIKFIKSSCADKQFYVNLLLNHVGYATDIGRKANIVTVKPQLEYHGLQIKHVPQ